jgi:hypothetical protein
MNDELERIWTEADVTYFRVLSRNSPGGTKETVDKLQDSRCPSKIRTKHLPDTNLDCYRYARSSYYVRSLKARV